MPWNGSGVFSRVYSWVSDNASGIAILPDRMDTDTDDIVVGLEHCLTVNGETVPTANLNMNNYRWTNASQGLAPSDYVTVGQVNSGGGGISGGGFVPIAGGTMTGGLQVSAVITTQGGNAGLQFNGRDGSSNFLWYATGGAARLWSGADRLTCDTGGNVVAAGSITASGNLQVNGTSNVNSTSTVGGSLNVSGGITTYGGVTCANNTSLTAAWVHSTGALQIDTSAQINQQLTVGGTIYCNTLQGSYVHSTGSLQVDGSATVNGNIACNQLNANNSVYTNYLQSNGNFQVGGNSQLQTVTCGNLGSQAFTCTQIITTSYIQVGQNCFPNADAAQYCGLAPPHSWLGVDSYNYYNGSSRAKKLGLAPVPAGCLELVRQIAPQSYRWVVAPAEPDEDPELELERQRLHYGFVADEVAAAMKAAGRDFGGYAVSADGAERLGLIDMLAVLWAAVRELSDQVAAQKGA